MSPCVCVASTHNFAPLPTRRNIARIPCLIGMRETTFLQTNRAAAAKQMAT